MSAQFDQETLLVALLHEDFYSFVSPVFKTLNPGTTFQKNWHIRAIAHHLHLVGTGEIKRLLITMPPRYLKSITASVAWPAWMLARDPSLRFFVASYSAELATKHSRDFRLVVESDWFRHYFPGFGVLKRATDTEIVTQFNGSRKAISLGGAATGFGADILIIDDLMKAADATSPVERQRVKDFYDHTLVSRLDNKSDGRIIAIQQRLHEDDLAGHLLEKRAFVHLNLPAIAEEDAEIPIGSGRVYRRRREEPLFPCRESLETLEGLRREMGRPAFSAQYQQNPVSYESALVRWEKIETYDEILDRSQYEMVIQSWDTAMNDLPTCDYSVGTTWGYADHCWWLLDLVRLRLDYPALKNQVLAEAAKWQADKILIEDTGTGTALLSDLYAFARNHRSVRWRLARFRSSENKATRLAAQSAKLEEGRALFPKTAPFLAELKREMMGFPQSKYDDQVDSITQFLETYGNTAYKRGRREFPRRNVIRR